jgi:hypothetical protein
MPPRAWRNGKSTSRRHEAATGHESLAASPAQQLDQLLGVGLHPIDGDRFVDLPLGRGECLAGASLIPLHDGEKIFPWALECLALPHHRHAGAAVKN